MTWNSNNTFDVIRKLSAESIWKGLNKKEREFMASRLLIASEYAKADFMKYMDEIRKPSLSKEEIKRRLSKTMDVLYKKFHKENSRYIRPVALKYKEKLLDDSIDKAIDVLLEIKSSGGN
jgi:hypothetical protein